MQEKLTISKAGEEKTVATKWGDKKKQSVQFVEYPNVWHGVWASGLKEGQVIEGTRESRDYQGKTYWDFKLPKMGGSGGNASDLAKIFNSLKGIELKLERLEKVILTPEIKTKLADEARGYHYPTPEEEGIDFANKIDTDDIPF